MFKSSGKRIRPYRHVTASLLCWWLFAGHAVAYPQQSADSVSIYQLIETANAKAAAGEKDSADFYFRQSGALAKAIESDDGFIRYTGDYTNFLYRELRYAEGLKIAEEQLQKSIATGDKNAEANAYNNIGLLYYAMSMMTKAADHYIKALETSEQSNDLYNQRKYHTNLASLFIDIQDYKKGYYYALKGYEIARDLNDSSAVARSLTNLIVVEAFMEKLEKAKAHSLELIDICEKKQYLDLIVIGYINLGDICFKQKQYDASIAVLQSAESKLQHAPPGYDAYVYHGLANAFKALKKYIPANRYFEKCMLNAAETMPLADLKAVYLLGADLKEVTNQYKEALDFRKKYQTVTDSLANQTSQQTIQEVEIRYQTSVKERQIAEQQLAIANHNNEIARKNNLIVIGSLVILLLLASGVIIFIVYRQKNRAMIMQQEVKVLEALLEGEERERKRTAKELHDAVASTLSAAKMQVNKISGLNNGAYAESKVKTLALIDAAVREVRNISHNMAPDILLEEGLSYAIENFCNKASNSNLHISAYFIGEIPKLNVQYELLIYRIIQEAVNNIIKHAAASEAVVQLTANKGQLDMTIEDNGRGFDVNAVPKNGIGISNLIHRIQLLNGSYEISSHIGGGTGIYINIPLDKICVPAIQSPSEPS